MIFLGSSETLLIITIMPDNTPELEEEITVTLTSVSPSDTQRLKVGSTQTTIIIPENDNPGGIFQFSSAMKTSYLVKVPITALLDRMYQVIDTSIYFAI